MAHLQHTGLTATVHSQYTVQKFLAGVFNQLSLFLKHFNFSSVFFFIFIRSDILRHYSFIIHIHMTTPNFMIPFLEIEKCSFETE